MAILSNLLCFPSEKRNLHLGANPSFQSIPLLKRGLVCRDTSKKSQKCLPYNTIAENLPIVLTPLTLSALQTEPDTFANSVDLDETARY